MHRVWRRYERMLDPKGNTAVYLLYAGARIASIGRKANVDFEELLASGTRVRLVEVRAHHGSNY